MIPRQESLEVAGLIREWLEKEVSPVCGEFDERGAFPKELYEQMAELGLNIMAVPEEYGGLGLSTEAQTLIAECFGEYEVGLGSAVGANASAVHLVESAGTDLQKKIFFDALCSGGWAAFGLTEPDAGSNAAAIKTTAAADGDDYVLNGSKCFITNGGIASVYVIMATVDRSLGAKGIACFLVERNREGLSVGKHENKMGIRLSNTTDVILENVRIPKEMMIAPPGDGYRVALRTLGQSRIFVGALGVGLASRALREAVGYAKVRKQFNKPIAELQAIQFMVADMAMQVEAGRQLVYHTAELVDMGRPYAKFSSMSKCYGADMAMKVAVDALQVFGGFGYMREYPMEKLVRDAKILQIYEGTNQIQRMIIAGHLFK